MAVSLGGLGLADDMGLGQTVQALAVILERVQVGPALVVVAPSAMSQGLWIRKNMK